MDAITGVLARMKFTAFDHTPPCRICTVPDCAPDATVATPCVSDQFTTAPYALPSHRFPTPCVAPNPVPVIVTCVPAAPEIGVTVVMLGVATVKFTAFDHTPPCSICAVPDFDPEATVRHHLRITPTRHHPVPAPQPDVPTALRRTTPCSRKRHLCPCYPRSRRHTGDC